MSYLHARWLILVFVLAAVRPSFAEVPQEVFNKQFSSSRITFLKEDSPYLKGPPGRYSPALRFLFEKVLAWVPTGKGSVMSEACRTELWSERLQDPRIKNSALLQGALVQKYFKDCAKDLQTGSTTSLGNSTGMMTMRLQPNAHPFFHPVLFHLPGDIKLKGLLALKGDFKKRPLVVFRAGVFNNVSEFFPERAWLMMLFEQSPFNVLLVENMTGSDFIADNTQFAFGGYDEGLQNILIAQILQDPNEPLHALVDSLHLFGVSLGGHGVLFASLLNELNSKPNQPLYQSFMGLCPVVDLKASMENLTGHRPFSYAADLWSRKRLAGLTEKLPGLEDHPSFAFLRTAVDDVVTAYHGGLSHVSSVRLPEGMQDGSNFWQLNYYWKYYKNVKGPVLVLATDRDPIVPFALNSQKIQNKTLELGRSNVSVVNFPEGVHCTLPVAYDWKAVSSILQAYILSHAPNFHLKRQELKIEVQSEPEGVGFREGAPITIDVAPGDGKDKFVQVNVHMQQSDGKNKDLAMNLPLSEFDFRFLDESLTPSEHWMIQRWVQQNLTMQMARRHGQWQLSASWPVAP
jgi:pimeloyl-ACP methyl ester carboxylesterase